MAHPRNAGLEHLGHIRFALTISVSLFHLGPSLSGTRSQRMKVLAHCPQPPARHYPMEEAMLLISGRFELVLIFFAVFLSFGRTRLDTLSTPIEALQLATVLAFYGLVVIAVALVLCVARWMQQTIASMGEAELRQ